MDIKNDQQVAFEFWATKQGLPLVLEFNHDSNSLVYASTMTQTCWEAWKVRDTKPKRQVAISSLTTKYDEVEYA